MKKRRIKTRTKVSEKREETNAPETVVLCFAVVARKREENRRRTERKRKVYPGFFLLKKSKSKKILTLQVLKRAPVGLLHDDDRLPPRSCFTPRSLCAFFCFFSAGGSRRARAALVFSRMKCREREREEGGFRLGKYDRQKREREKERKIFIFAREEKESSFFGPSLVRISYSATRASSLSRGRFPFAFDYCCKNRLVRKNFKKKKAPQNSARTHTAPARARKRERERERERKRKMKLSEYQRVKSTFTSLPMNSPPPMHLLLSQFPSLSLDALFSIYGQEFSRKLRQTHGKFVRSIESLEKRYLNGEDIFDIAMNVDFPACQLLRLIIESVLKVNHKSVGKMLKRPYDSNTFPSEVPEDSRAMTSGLNSNKGKKLIERLKVDCERVVAWDCGASPATERSRREAGLEYEKILEERLRDIGAEFETETDLRAEGASRTPDVRLKVPISVRGRTIHWIDSKASFCDPQVHEESGSKQFRAYVNRFGSGMVIYWHGVVEELREVDPNVLLVEDFPERKDIVMLERFEEDGDEDD